MLSADTPQDYVIASGSTHSLYEFATAVLLSLAYRSQTIALLMKPL